MMHFSNDFCMSSCNVNIQIPSTVDFAHIFSDTLTHTKSSMLCSLFLAIVIFDVHCWVQNTILVCYENINFTAVSLPHQSQIWARAQHPVYIS